MNRKPLWMYAVILSCSLVLTACDFEVSNSSETSTDEYRAKIANTRWQLAEAMNHNNEWVAPDFYAGVDIPELSFGLDNKYFMRICKSANRQNVTLINGTYDIDRDVINMTDDCYQGIAYSFKISALSGSTLEGQFTDWGQEQQASDAGGTTTTYEVRHYTLRLKRTENKTK